MYKQPEVLSTADHKSLTYSPQTTFEFARQLTRVPLLDEEVALASAWYPVVFSGQDGGRPLALLGLGDTNCYVDSTGRWTAGYIPAFVRRYPFAFGQTEADAETFHLTLDRSAAHFQGEGEPLFTAEGQPGAVIERAMQFMTQYQRAVLRTQASHKALAQSGVIVPKVLNVQQGSERHAIGGFSAVDEGAFKALPDATLAQWARNGVLATVYAHFASLRHLQALVAAQSQPDKTH